MCHRRVYKFLFGITFITFAICFGLCQILSQIARTIGQRWQFVRLFECAEIAVGLYAFSGVEMAHE